jgi:hypothetical protein
MNGMPQSGADRCATAESRVTLPTADILSGKNVRALVSMVSYLKKYMKIKMLKRKRNPGSPLEVTC